MTREIKLYTKKLIKEYIGNTATKEEQADFLDRVLDRLADMDANTNFIITTAFGNNIASDFTKMKDMELENLYNLIDQKLKTQNERSPYYYDENSNFNSAF